ncbi:hypothetical protein [Streptomyces sp. B21-083]|uniref:hypothetical protein n=1 Tax=Streptomyces sp. B21-083 TaxID=3039410 RepID=UPI002FF11AF8
MPNPDLPDDDGPADAGTPATGAARDALPEISAGEDPEDEFDAEEQQAPSIPVAPFLSIVGNLLINSTVHDGVTAQLPGSAALELPVRAGTVRRAERDFVTTTFVEPSEYRAAAQTVRRHLVLLTGPDGVGKRAFALHLLEQYAEDAGEVKALDAEQSLEDLTDELRPGTCYLLDLDDADQLAITPARLQVLLNALRATGAYLAVVLTQPPSAPMRAITGIWRPYLISCTAPDPVTVARNHLAHHLGPGWADNHPGLLDDDVLDALRLVPGPGQAAAVARDLAGAALGRYAKTDVLDAVRDRDHAGIADWFTSHPNVRTWAWMLATAVFEGQDRGVIADRATALEAVLASGSEAPAGSAWPPPGSSKELDAIRAAPEPAASSGSFPRYNLERVRFLRPGWAQPALDHAWREYPTLRDPLLNWLAATPLRGDLQDLAGAAAGFLTAATTGHQALAPLRRWARQDRPRQELAARALGAAAAHDPAIATQVRRLLGSFSRADAGKELRRTAALAYGTAYGLAYPQTALRRLMELARAEEREVAQAAVNGLLALHRAGATSGPAALLHQLAAWDLSDDQRCGTAADLVSGLLTVTYQRPAHAGTGLPEQTATVLSDPEAAHAAATALAALSAHPAGYGRVLDWITGWLFAVRGHPQHTLVRDLIETIFTNLRHLDTERLAYDLTRLAHEQPHAEDLETLRPALRAFEEPALACGGPA